LLSSRSSSLFFLSLSLSSLSSFSFFSFFSLSLFSLSFSCAPKLSEIKSHFLTKQEQARARARAERTNARMNEEEARQKN